MKYSQLYMLFAQMSFVGSLLTHRVASSLLLLAMFFYWGIWGVILYFHERRIERMELRRSLFYDAVKNLLTPMEKPKRRKK